MKKIFLAVLICATVIQVAVSQSFDFVPGNKTVINDTVQYKIGDVPSLWKVLKGTVEAQDFEGTRVISMVSRHADMTPRLPAEFVMPDRFTLEFDVYFIKGKYSRYNVSLRDESKKRTPEEKELKEIIIHINRASYGNTNASVPKTSELDQGWRRISISYDKATLKVYMDNHRLINMTEVPGTPSGLTISVEHNQDVPSLIKSIAFKVFATNTMPTSGSMGQ